MTCFGFKLELVKHVPSYAQVLVGAKNTMFCRFWRRDRLPPAMLVILGYYWNLIVQHLSVFISSSSMHLCVEKWSHLQIDFFVACQHLCHAGMGSTRSEALWSSWQFGRWQCTVVPLIVLKDETNMKKTTFNHKKQQERIQLQGFRRFRDGWRSSDWDCEAVILLATLACFAALLFLPELVASGLLAYSFGLRHAVDVDHIDTWQSVQCPKNLLDAYDCARFFEGLQRFEMSTSKKKTNSFLKRKSR